MFSSGFPFLLPESLAFVASYFGERLPALINKKKLSVFWNALNCRIWNPYIPVCGLLNAFQSNTQSVYRNIRFCYRHCFKLHSNTTKVFNLLQAEKFLNMNLCCAVPTKECTGPIFRTSAWCPWSFKLQFQTAMTLNNTSFFLEQIWILPIDLILYKKRLFIKNDH